MAGIPDLRLGGDPYLTIAEDHEAASRLAEREPTMSFAELLESYYANNTKVPAHQARAIVRATLAASDRAGSVVGQWLHAEPVPSGTQLDALDVGCGTGPLSVALGRAGFRVSAVDIGVRWLVLARARAREHGIELSLACADAAALPYRAEQFAMVGMESLLELVTDRDQTLVELRRVLRPGGRLSLTTPNRWFVGPDPHIGLPGGSLMPDRIIAAYSAMRGILPPKRRLTGGSELRRALGRAGFADVRLEPLAIPDSYRQRAAAPVRAGITAFEAMRRRPWLSPVLVGIGPVIVASARASAAVRSRF